jgi:hypothetical protein
MGVKGVIVLGHTTHRFPCLLLTLLPLSQVGRRLPLDILGQTDVAGKVRRPARRAWPTLVVLLPLPLHVRVRLGTRYFLLSRFHLAVKRQAGSLTQFTLHVE